MAKLLSKDISELSNILRNQQFIMSSRTSGNVMFDHWPMSSGDYMDTWEDVFTTSDYGDDYNSLKATADFSPMSNYKTRNLMEQAYNNSYSETFNLVTKGYTPMRLLGKQHDMQMNKSVFRDRIRALTGRNLRHPLVDDWARLSVNEPDLTPEEFIKANSVERIIRNPALVDQLKTKEQLTALNYNFQERGIPITTNEQGEALYDSLWFRDKKQRTNYATSRISPDLSINDFGNMKVIENFDSVLDTISKNTKILIIEDPLLSANDVTLRKRKLYSVGRAVKNTVKKMTNRREHGVKDSYVLRYSPQNTKAEQLYIVLKGLCSASVEPYLNKIERSIRAGGATNLPGLNEFESDRGIIKNAAACLIASQICNMFNLEANDAYIFSEAFRAEACQNLANAKAKLDNKWTMPLISDMFAMSVFKFAEDFKINRDVLATKLGATQDDILNLGAALFAKRQPVESNILGATLALKSSSSAKDVFDKSKFKGLSINKYLKEVDKFINNRPFDPALPKQDQTSQTDAFDLTDDLDASAGTGINHDNLPENAPTIANSTGTDIQSLNDEEEIRSLFEHFKNKQIASADLQDYTQDPQIVESTQHDPRIFDKDNVIDADWKPIYEEDEQQNALAKKNEMSKQKGYYVTVSDVMQQMYHDAMSELSKNALPGAEYALSEKEKAALPQQKYLPEGDEYIPQNYLPESNAVKQNNLSGVQTSLDNYPNVILLPPVTKEIPELKNFNEEMLVENAKKAEELNKQELSKSIAAHCKELVRKEVYTQGVRLLNKTLKNEDDLTKLDEMANKTKINNIKNFNNEATKFSQISGSLSLGLDALKNKFNVDTIKKQIEISTKNVDSKKKELENVVDTKNTAKELENLKSREVTLHSLTGSVELNSYALSLTDKIMEFYNTNKNVINSTEPRKIIAAYAESTYSIANGTTAVGKLKKDIRAKCANPVITKTYLTIYGNPNKVDLNNDKLIAKTSKATTSVKKTMNLKSTPATLQASLKTF